MNNQIDLELTETNSELTFFVDSRPLSVDDYLDGVDTVLDQIAREGNFELGASVVRSMTTAHHAVGISLAKLLHGMKALWHEEQDFYEFLANFTSVSQLTADRYIDAWSGFVSAPLELRDRFVKMPMKNLNALGAAISQGYSLEDSDWNKLSTARVNGEFLRIIREDVKQRPPRSNSIMIVAEKSGDLMMWANGIRQHIGYLNINSDDPNVAKAVARILKGAGIMIRDV